MLKYKVVAILKKHKLMSSQHEINNTVAFMHERIEAFEAYMFDKLDEYCGLLARGELDDSSYKWN